MWFKAPQLSTYCQGIALKYEEDFKLALESFAQASALDPTWQEPRGQEAVLIKYLQVVLMYLTDIMCLMYLICFMYHTYLMYLLYLMYLMYLIYLMYLVYLTYLMYQIPSKVV